MNESFLHQKQFADFAPVDLDSPIQFHVVLMDQQRPRFGVGLALKTQVQPEAIHFCSSKTIPFRLSFDPEMKSFFQEERQFLSGGAKQEGAEKQWDVSQ